jgi:hypothetical protein
MKFFFLRGKRYKAMYGELSGVHEKPLSVWRHLNVGLNDSKRAIFPLMAKTGQRNRRVTLRRSHLSFSACFLPKGLATRPHTIEEIIPRRLRMRKFTRRSTPHELTPTHKAKRVEEARKLLQAPRSDSEKDFVYIIPATVVGSTIAVNRR